MPASFRRSFTNLLTLLDVAQKMALLGTAPHDRLLHCWRMEWRRRES
ncbi:hypothetical protein [Telmatospirillum sp. J64-1]|nr:hypothetical protein [Telmatospirillum sp. J64-1]